MSEAGGYAVPPNWLVDSLLGLLDATDSQGRPILDSVTEEGRTERVREAWASGRLGPCAAASTAYRPGAMTPGVRLASRPEDPPGPPASPPKPTPIEIHGANVARFLRGEA